MTICVSLKLNGPEFCVNFQKECVAQIESQFEIPVRSVTVVQSGRALFKHEMTLLWSTATPHAERYEWVSHLRRWYENDGICLQATRTEGLIK